jgi:hypothetical protein
MDRWRLPLADLSAEQLDLTRMHRPRQFGGGARMGRCARSRHAQGVGERGKKNRNRQSRGSLDHPREKGLEGEIWVPP